MLCASKNGWNFQWLKLLSRKVQKGMILSIVFTLLHWFQTASQKTKRITDGTHRHPSLSDPRQHDSHKAQTRTFWESTGIFDSNSHCKSLGEEQPIFINLFIYYILFIFGRNWNESIARSSWSKMTWISNCSAFLKLQQLSLLWIFKNEQLLMVRRIQQEGNGCEWTC